MEAEGERRARYMWPRVASDRRLKTAVVAGCVGGGGGGGSGRRRGTASRW